MKIEKVDSLRDVWSYGAKAFNPLLDEAVFLHKERGV